MVSSETITFEVDEDGECCPWILVDKKDVGSDTVISHKKRLFRMEVDMNRVLDFKAVGAGVGADEEEVIVDHMEDCTMWLCTTDRDGMVSFPKRRMCLRGGYLFYNQDTDDSDTATTNNNNNNNENSKEDGATVTGGVIPLENVVVDFPPGGRRVFREHAMTDARSGYEFCLRHVLPQHANESSDDEDYYDDDDDDENDGNNNNNNNNNNNKAQAQRKKQYLVAESLGQRESWAKAITNRAKVSVKQPTHLRPTANRVNSIDPSGNLIDMNTIINNSNNNNNNNNKRMMPSHVSNIPELPLHSPAELFNNNSNNNNSSNNNNNNTNKLGGGGNGGEEQQKHVDEALEQFGQGRFDESLWVDDYFEKHEDFDAPAICRTLEKWQAAVKQGLRGAVLEQYEYFVEASREMTTMGREVAHLRNLVENQLQTVQTMKEIDFASAFDYHHNDEPVIILHDEDNDDYYNVNDHDDNDDNYDDDNYSTDDENNLNTNTNTNTNNNNNDDQSSHSSNPYDQPFDMRRAKHNNNNNNNNLRLRQAADETTMTLMEIPEWLDDVPEEISAFIKECRYTDATELLLKAKAEIADTLTMHEKLTDKTLSKKHLATLSRMSQQLQNLSDRMANRLAESLRRKNEAMRQAAKRERADPLSHLAPLISPICLNDDASALHLLVRLGRHHNAATAYAARRSLLLMESLQERPIASLTTGSNNNADTGIYAAQLSQSFFSCLAMAVEGFLDLFLERTNDTHRDELMEEMSSINSNTTGRNVPAGALSAIVLWCDSELSKFASVFGGSRLLGNLALAPKVVFNNRKNINNALSTAISKFENIAGIAQQKNQLRTAEENGEFQVAAMLRRKIAQYQKDQKDGIIPKDSLLENNNNKKERQDAINIAANCIDQAFQFASQNLDSIGLPLLSRLAECMRSRLKGCESEIADALGPKWYHVTYDWKEPPPVDDTIMPERRRSTIVDSKTISSNDTGSNS